MKNRLFLMFAIGVFFCMIGWTASAQLQRIQPNRQSWEYKSIAVDGSYWEEDGRQAGGNPLRDLRPKIRELGEQGWEMVAISDETGYREGQTSLTSYSFKRAK